MAQGEKFVAAWSSFKEVVAPVECGRGKFFS
jgi:hypothetical protein